MVEIAWDIELLERVHEHVERISTNLQTVIANLKQIKEQANGEWQSEAGKVYSGRIDTDIQEMSDLYDAFFELTRKVSEARKEYASVELDISNALTEALSNLSIPF